MLYSSKEYLSLREYLVRKPIWIWVVIIILVIIGLGFGGYGVYELVSTNDQEIVTSNDISSQVCEQTADFGQITVYISGAVVNPGVYILESGNRIVDLLDESGGISKAADALYVNRQFNLAKRLSDGDQIYIPTQDETEKQIVVGDVLNDPVDMSSQGPISINSSTKSELMELSGIGEARATKIIENRPYSSSQELVEKGVLSSSLLEEIISQISI
ncbi:helix-hairpin-helix domain-containing protein [Candidatus Woesebacteria bacterium]|nr:helix-hairpin-helix domain-containing protein [Candidatus Woesebacteria bacterium]